MVKFKKVPTISGLVSFSPTLHTRVRAQVPRDQDHGHEGEGRRLGHRQGRPEDLSGMARSAVVPGDRPGPPRAVPWREPPWPDPPTVPTPQGTLRALSVSRSFEGVQALDDVTLELRQHEVVGLIGPNGAGKSTLVNLMTGFDLPTSGTIELDGREITGWSPHRRARSGLARTFQHSKSFRDLTVRENVEVAALGVGAGAARGAHARRRAAAAARASTAQAEAPAGSLAHGDERRLGVARALAMRPSFVLMDEPAAGLPEAEVPEFAAVVRAVRDDHGAGVLLIDHNMALIMDVCDRIHVLDQGATLAEGAPGEIRANLDVAAAYLGESAVREEDAE